MSTLQTYLTQFRFFSNNHDPGSYLVEWYKLEENEDNSESYGICMTPEELKILRKYIESNPVNFHNMQSAFCDDTYSPRCGNNDLTPINATKPINLVLRKYPIMPNRPDTIFPCMDIQLLDKDGQLNHNFHLEFDLIGKILKS